MALHSAVSDLGPEFHPFLYAPIGKDSLGKSLSVLSALARGDLDPWDEAATLTQLPKGAAIARLADLVARLPDAVMTDYSPEATAKRLVALLPRRRLTDVASAKAPAAVVPAKEKISVDTYLLLCVLACVLLAIALSLSGASGSGAVRGRGDQPSSNVTPY